MKRKRARLSLKRETLRNLEANALRHVRGAGVSFDTNCELSELASECELCGTGGAASADDCTGGCPEGDSFNGWTCIP